MHPSNSFLIRVAWRRALSLNSEGLVDVVHIVFVGGRQEAPEEEKIRWLQYHQRPASSRHIEIRVVSCGILSCKPWKQIIDSCNMDIKDKGYHLWFAHVLLKFATFYFNLKVLFSWKIFLALIHSDMLKWTLCVVTKLRVCILWPKLIMRGLFFLKVVAVISSCCLCLLAGCSNSRRDV